MDIILSWNPVATRPEPANEVNSRTESRFVNMLKAIGNTSQNLGINPYRVLCAVTLVAGVNAKRFMPTLVLVATSVFIVEGRNYMENNGLPMQLLSELIVIMLASTIL